jgi:hypothetical protein
VVDEQELDVRVGVNTGEAIVTLGARPSEGEGMVAGDVVNTAARIQAAAPPNAILVGEQTRRATRTRISYREAEPVIGKGKAEPIPVWEATGATARFGVDLMERQTVALVGRDRERALLVDTLERVRETRSPHLVTLVAAPGMGKSRLVRELFEAVEALPDLIAWRQGRSLPYGEGVTYWALGEIVKAQAGVLESDPPDVVESRLDAAVRAVARDDQEAGWLQANLRPLLGLGAAGEAQEGRRAEAFAAWRRFLEALAEQRPLVLVFEDLQWADDGLLDFVDHLVEWAAGVPLLVVATARPELLERRSGWGGGKRNATTVSLTPLGETETARLLAELLGQAVLPAETQTTLLGRIAGNPLYAEEFARMVADGEATAAGVPETLQGLIAARLDALPAAEKALVQHAAVVGKVFWLGALSVLANDARWELEERMHALARKEFVSRERLSSLEGDVEYAFVHGLIRDVAYAQIPRLARADRHLAVARWLEATTRTEDAAEMLSHHYLAALQYSRDAVVGDTADAARRALGDAASRALSLSAFDSGERFAAAALELSEPGSEEWAALLLRRIHAVRGGRLFSARASLEQWSDELEAAGFREEAADARSLASWSAWLAGDLPAAQTESERARALLADAPPSEAKATVLTRSSRLAALAGDNDDALATAEEALAMARDLGLLRVESEAVNNRGLARLYGGDTDGLADLERSIELGRRAGSPFDLVRGLGNLSSTVQGLGDVARGYALAMEGLAEAEHYGLEGGTIWLRGERIFYDYLHGDWDDALRRGDDWLDRRQGQLHFLEFLVHVVRSLVSLARGDLARAAAEDEEQLAQALPQDPQARDAAYAFSAFVQASVGAQDEANRRLDKLLSTWRQAPSKVNFFPTEPAFAAVLLGRVDEFLAAAADAMPTRWLTAATAFARGDHAAAIRELDEMGCRPQAAYTRLAAAEALSAAGRDPSAPLSEALEFYRSVGATLYLRRGEEVVDARAAS